MLKARWWLLLPVLVLAGVAAGCGGGDAGDAGEATGGEAAATTDAGAAGVQCETFTVADFDSDDVRASYHAIDEGIVESDVIGEVTVDYLALPALIQTTGSDRYDVTSTSLIGFVLARERGNLDLRGIAFKQAHNGGGQKLFVAADSEIDEPADLKGKTIGVTSFGSTATLTTRILLQKEYGLDTSEDGGDVTFTELDPPTLVNALKNGDVDAADLFHVGGWQALNDPEIEVLIETDEVYREMTGEWPVGGMLTVRAETLDERAECVEEFQRMLEESVAYAEENTAEVAQAVSETTGVSAEFIEYWWGGAYRYGASVDDEWVAMATTFWDEAHEYGAIPTSPDADEVVFRP